MSKSRPSWKKTLRWALRWARAAPGLALLVDFVIFYRQIPARSLELPGPSELPNALLHTLGLALQTRPWITAGILALFILWLLLHILDRRHGDHRPVGDYWGHSVTWIVYYFGMVGWELVKLMIPSISNLPAGQDIWALLVAGLIVDCSLWVVALGTSGFRFDRFNWDDIDMGSMLVVFFTTLLVWTLQGKATDWSLPISMVIVSIAIILLRLHDGLPAREKYRWIRWVFLGALGVGWGVFFFELARDGDSSFTGLSVGLISVILAVGTVALFFDFAVQIHPRGRRHRIDEINYRYRRGR